MPKPSFVFIFILVLIDSLIPMIKKLAFNQIDWFILVSIVGTFGILYAIYFRQKWGYGLAIVVFGLKTISSIAFLSFYITEFGISGIISNQKLFLINSFLALEILLSFPLLLFFINRFKTYKPKQDSIQL
jgi:hypothetical protein